MQMASTRRVNRRTIARLGDGEVALGGGLDPQFDRDLGLGNCLLRRCAMGGARLEIRNACDPAFVVLIPEDIDMVTVLHHQNKSL